MKIADIWIESEIKGTILGGQLYTNDNSDVIVTFNNGEKYVATFFTYENIEHLRKKNRETGECNSGSYFWASNMIIVDRIDKDTITTTIEDLINTESFYNIFKAF